MTVRSQKYSSTGVCSFIAESIELKNLLVFHRTCSKLSSGYAIQLNMHLFEWFKNILSLTDLINSAMSLSLGGQSSFCSFLLFFSSLSCPPSSSSSPSSFSLPPFGSPCHGWHVAFLVRNGL